MKSITYHNIIYTHTYIHTHMNDVFNNTLIYFVDLLLNLFIIGIQYLSILNILIINSFYIPEIVGFS